MIKLLAILILIFYPLGANAAQTLNKQVIKSFYKVTEKFDELEDKYRDTFKIADSFSMKDNDKIIKHLKKSDAYKDIKSILSSHNFNSLEEFFDASYQLMGSMYSVQVSKVPSNIDLDAVDKMMEKNLENMKKSGVAADIISDMEADIKEQKSAREDMKFASENASEENKQFVKDNFEWIMNLLPNSNSDDDYDDGEQNNY